MDRSSPDQLTVLARQRADALEIVRAAIRAVSPDSILPAARRSLPATFAHAPARLHVVAVGKAAAGMYAACVRSLPEAVASALVIGPGDRPDSVPPEAWVSGGHPTPTEGSVAGGRRALAAASAVAPDQCLLLLMSGGASALMAAPLDGLTLAAKQQAARLVMASGGDITALNALRKHLSAVKGGRLAAACAGRTITLALSDVVGDDLSVIGSGPGMPDASTWADAREVLRRFGGSAHDSVVTAVVDAGCRGERPETPKAGDAATARAEGQVIAGRAQAMAAARAAAADRGYAPLVIDAPVVGEAREAAARWWVEAQRGEARPLAVISSGETTVRVTGGGRGGRNQEFALALVEPLAQEPAATLVSVGTDGIDGPTDAAGAIVDASSAARARARGLDAPAAYLSRNDSYAYFARLDDLIRTGPTGTNVGDLQVLLLGAN